MAAMSTEELAKLLHSPVHLAIARRDHLALRRILASVPLPSKASEICTEEQSTLAEKTADEASAVIDRRDVPGRETPLHLAARLGDAKAVEMLMASGADWTLQNEHGWSALQEAVCAREDTIAMIMTRYYQLIAWRKWCRRLPRVTGAIRRMRDFYMELTFHFESSVIPFIGRIAPSDTYRIWKRGSNLRMDTTLPGFDNFRIQRSNRSFLFLGDGSENGKLSAGSLCVLTHKEKEVTRCAGVRRPELKIAQEAAAQTNMHRSKTNMFRPGFDVTQVELISHLNWRRQERTEMVGAWKAKIYDMHHVMFVSKSRRVPGAMTDEEPFAVDGDRHEGAELDEDYADILTAEEKLKLESALKRESFDFGHESGVDHGPGRPSKAGLQKGSYDSFDEEVDATEEDSSFGFQSSCPSLSIDRHEPREATLASSNNEKKSWFGWGRESVKVERRGRDKPPKKLSKEPTRRRKTEEGNHESEYTKGLRPALWLTPDFPLQTEELLPLLDIFADKVKIVRRLRELLTTKMPNGTFPVKVAIPVVPTIRLVITCTKFEERKSSEEFSYPVSSPGHFQDLKEKEADAPSLPGTSWFSWIRGATNQGANGAVFLEDHVDEEVDPFHIPSDYIWVDNNELKRRMKEKKGKTKRGNKPVRSRAGK